MSRRYHSNLPADSHQVLLDGPEFHHLSHVARLQAGDIVTLFDGLGQQAEGVIHKLSKKEALIELRSRSFSPGTLPLQVTIGTALPKGDREMFLVEKITELGVGDLVPLATKRSVVHPRDARVRLGRYALEACKQSGRNLLPEIAELTPFETFVKQCRHEQRWILHILQPNQAGAAAPMAAPACANLQKGGSLALAIGPEGGFTEAEWEMALELGWQTWSIPGNILRIETAAIYAASIIRAHFPG